MNDDCPKCMRACMRVSCASIQCAVVRGESIYCSKNIGRPWWKGKEAERYTESLISSRGRGIGGRAEEVEGRKKGKTANVRGGEGASLDRVIIA